MAVGTLTSAPSHPRCVVFTAVQVLLGYVFVYCTVPFGYKLGAWIHTVHGMLYTSFVRSLGAVLSQFIDDHSVCGMKGDHTVTGVDRAVYLLLLVKGVYGGYFFSQAKCIWRGHTVFRSLGMNCDRGVGAFRIPEAKVVAFVSLGQALLDDLERAEMDRLSGARFAGQAIGFLPAQPGMRWWVNGLYVELGNRALTCDTDEHAMARATTLPWWHISQIQFRPLREVMVVPLRQEIKAAMLLAQTGRVHLWKPPHHTSLARLYNDTTLCQSGLVLHVDVAHQDRELRGMFCGNRLVFGQTLCVTGHYLPNWVMFVPVEWRGAPTNDLHLDPAAGRRCSSTCTGVPTCGRATLVAASSQVSLCRCWQFSLCPACWPWLRTSGWRSISTTPR